MLWQSLKKEDKTEPKNYRPISLLSCLGKVYEKVLANELTMFLEANSIMSRRQYGFRKGKSSADLVLNLTPKGKRH